MDVSSACTIDTRIVYGFKGAGKTSYISDCIKNDYFYKYGSTLILCFEQGKEEYDTEMLQARNAFVTYYDGHSDIEDFCLDQIMEYHPDRIYVEMSAMLKGLKEQLPDVMDATYTVTWFDWSTLDLYMQGFRQEISQMVAESQQVTFRGCPSKKLLVPFSQTFQLINHRASYLRQDPMGYHEKAFDLFLPFSLEEEQITITANEYLVFWLDAAEHPEHYEGKLLKFTDPLEVRHVTGDDAWSAGRVVMTCCMADLQFMSFELTGQEAESIQGGWVTMDAIGQIGQDEYGRKVLKLKLQAFENASAPGSGMILQVR